MFKINYFRCGALLGCVRAGRAPGWGWAGLGWSCWARGVLLAQGSPQVWLPPGLAPSAAAGRSQCQEQTCQRDGQSCSLCQLVLGG